MKSGRDRDRINLGLVLSLTLVLLLSGCNLSMELDSGPQVAAQAETATLALITTVENTNTPIPTDIPTATSTATPIPTETPTPVPDTATPTPSPTATATEPPTTVPTPTYPPPPIAVNVPVLMYHYISEVPADADIYRQDLTVPPERFEAHLQYLQEQGYTTVTLSDIYETLSVGRLLPPRPIVLTFDDGYKDAYTHVLPLLQKYGFIGEFFLLTTPPDSDHPAYVSWAEAKEMNDAGMSIQAHGRDHVDLTNRSNAFLVFQVLGAREAIEAHVGQPVRFFCYPSGRHDTAAEALVASANYWGAVTTAWGTELRLDNRYTWPRIRVRGAWGAAELAHILQSLKGGY